MGYISYAAIKPDYIQTLYRLYYINYSRGCFRTHTTPPPSEGRANYQPPPSIVHELDGPITLPNQTNGGR